MNCRRIATALTFVVLAGLPAVPGQGSAQEPAATTEAVRATWEGYIRAFGEGRVDFIADSVYVTPSFHPSPDGLTTLTTTAAIRDFFAAARENAGAQGYHHSETRAATVCPLTETTAVLSVEYTRHRADGQVLSQGAGTYLFTRRADGWRILGQIGHPADRLLTCTSGGSVGS